MRNIEKVMCVLKELGGSGTISEITIKYECLYKEDFNENQTQSDKENFVRGIIALHCIGFDEYQQNRHNTAYFTFDSDSQVINLNAAMINADC